MDRSITLGWIAASSMLAGCVVTASGAATSELKDGDGQSSGGIAYSQEKQRAFKTLTGLEFPEAAAAVAAYCDRIAPGAQGIVASVSGYADDSSCRRLRECAEPLAEGGYQYVEIEYQPLRSVSTDSIIPGKYRFSVAQVGDPACEIYDRYLETLESDEMRRTVKPATGRCFTITKIEEFSAAYTVGEYSRTNFDLEDFGHAETKIVVKETQSGEVLATSRHLAFGSADKNPNWTISCRNQNVNQGFIRSVLPPVK